MTDDSVIAAEEGADRVAARGRRANGSEKTAYTCENCGLHDLHVITFEPWSRTERRSKPCECGHAEEAGYMEVVIERVDTVRAVLDPEHRPQDREDLEPEAGAAEEEIMDQEVICARCFDDPDIEWVIEVVDADELNLDGIDRYVECAHCGHEIEFGYSHENHVGRLWPCESSDFNPWKTFPDRKYVEAWRRRGWLRPRS